MSENDGLKEESNTSKVSLKEYTRSLEMEREMNERITASMDLGDVYLEDGKKVGLSIVKMDDFPVQTDEGKVVTTSAYLLRKVHGQTDDDLTEFRNAGEKLELTSDDKRNIIKNIKELNLPLALAIPLALDEFNYQVNPEYLGKCLEPPLLIGMTGEIGTGKTKTLTFLAKNKVYATSFENISYFSMFRYFAYTQGEKNQSNEFDDAIREVRQKGKPSTPMELPHLGSGVSALARSIDEGYYHNDYLFVDLPPDWRERAKKNIAPKPHAFDMFASSMGVMLNASDLAADGKEITPQDMESFLNLVKSDHFKQFKRRYQKRERVVRDYVLQALE